MLNNFMKHLDFKPAFGLSSKHLQIVLSAFLPPGKAPPSDHLFVDIGKGDKLSCHVSTPASWDPQGRIVVLIHGLGGSHNSRYMVRMARKLYARNDKVVRVNLRNCGTGEGLSSLPYCGGNSQEIREVLHWLKNQHPYSEIQLIGFSLGGNIVLKMAGELGDEAKTLIKTCIAVCPPINLEQCVNAIERREHAIYHSYYLNSIIKQARQWLPGKISSIYEFDDKLTAPLWGFSGAKEYYQACSSENFLSKIACESHLLFARDDPFISLDSLESMSLPKSVNIWVAPHGGHMGFLGKVTKPKEFHWMDQQLLKWTSGIF